MHVFLYYITIFRWLIQDVLLLPPIRWMFKDMKRKPTEKRVSMASENEYIPLQLARKIGIHNILVLCPFPGSMAARFKTLYWWIEPFFYLIVY